MKRFVSFFFVCVILLCATPAGKNGSQAAEADALNSDERYRIRLRLDDLGYLDAPAAEISDGAFDAVTTAFVGAAGVSANAFPDAVFAASAPGSPLAIAKAFNAPAPAQALIGRLSEWEIVRTKLAVGASYVVTSCVSGSVIHATYTEEAGFAAMTPLSAWDAATVLGQFADLRSLDKHPVTIAIGSARIAASLILDPHADQADPVKTGCFRLYFQNAPSSVGGITDAEHQAVVYSAGY